MKTKERKKLNVFEMKCLRSMCGVSRWDRIRNEVVRERTGVRKELAVRVDKNVLRWFGHVERMGDERLLKKVVNTRVDGRGVRPIVISVRHNPKLLDFVFSRKLTFKKLDRDIHDA